MVFIMFMFQFPPLIRRYFWWYLYVIYISHWKSFIHCYTVISSSVNCTRTTYLMYTWLHEKKISLVKCEFFLHMMCVVNFTREKYMSKVWNSHTILNSCLYLKSSYSLFNDWQFTHGKCIFHTYLENMRTLCVNSQIL